MVRKWCADGARMVRKWCADGARMVRDGEPMVRDGERMCEPIVFFLYFKYKRERKKRM
jgi:hypothetical protein